MQDWIFDIRSRTFFLLLVSFLILLGIAVSKIFLVQDTNFEIFVSTLVGNRAIDLGMSVFSEIGWVLYPVFVSIILFIVKRTRRLGLVLLLSLLVGTMIAAYMRCYSGYEKPALDYLGYHLAIKSGADVGVPCQIDGSFPSGDAVRTSIFAFVVGYALSRRFPRGCYFLWIYPAVVSISKLYLLQEYPLTVISGIVFGILIADIVCKKLKIELIWDKLKT